MEDCKEADIWIATTTVASLADARELAAALIDQRVAACVQLDEGVRSFYAWNGRKCEDAEVRLTIKTTAAARSGVRALLARRHPYELPQLVEWPAAATPAYAEWVRQQVHAAA